ncbi:hypothetical protein [Streptomyces sp. NPDC004528]|uniref:hypothetical protein n=1 Tax=Streptomyces sp. NPDC004528 TaxID=3154550 RepID=UPI0033B47C93
MTTLGLGQETAGPCFGNLNRAVCHACALLRETSYEAGGTLVDRVIVIGGQQIPGYLESIVTAARSAADALEES